MLVTVPSAVGCCDECDRDSGLFCGLKADAAAGWAPDFLLRAPAQSILLCATHRTTLYLCGLQETVTAANLCVSLTKTLKISTPATIEGFFFFKTVLSVMLKAGPLMNGRAEKWKHKGGFTNPYLRRLCLPAMTHTYYSILLEHYGHDNTVKLDPQSGYQTDFTHIISFQLHSAAEDKRVEVGLLEDFIKGRLVLKCKIPFVHLSSIVKYAILLKSLMVF